MQNNTDTDLLVTVRVNRYQTTVPIPTGKTSLSISIPSAQLIIGTNEVKISIPGGETIVEHLISKGSEHSSFRKSHIPLVTYDRIYKSNAKSNE
ncbi:hypothetical protein [Arcticibacter svalbardensis]|uniref:hypothetical protein n=1 Tax=Arcticibacter svalbardensis TaxID=1288027 RepID=UPI001267CBE1|nr:hypothetical protein [Arcticibacter svalbardensis]